MNKRPVAVTVISWIFIVAGIVGLAYHGSQLNALRPFDYELLWICFVRVLAILSGAFMLRGRNWARWGAVVWLAYHVILSVRHTLSGLLTHSLLLVAFAYFLFRSRASAYFRGAKRTEQDPSSHETPAA